MFLKLNTSYVRYFNEKYKLTGKLFGNRFYSCVLDEAHFVEAIRYVELNPFRAGLEGSLVKYKWTSAHERLSRRKEYYLSALPSFFSVTSHFEFLTEPIQGALSDFKNRWAAIRGATKSGNPLGGKEFIQKVGASLGRVLGLNYKSVPT